MTSNSTPSDSSKGRGKFRIDLLYSSTARREYREELAAREHAAHLAWQNRFSRMANLCGALQNRPAKSILKNTELQQLQGVPEELEAGRVEEAGGSNSENPDKSEAQGSENSQSAGKASGKARAEKTVSFGTSPSEPNSDFNGPGGITSSNSTVSDLTNGSLGTSGDEKQVFIFDLFELSRESSTLLTLEIPTSSPLHPHKFPLWKKAYTVMLYAFAAVGAQLSSSIFSAGEKSIQQGFSVSPFVSHLSNSAFMAGVAFGPMIFAPLSEVHGRKKVVFGPVLVSCVLVGASFGVEYFWLFALLRFGAGLLSSAPIISSGAALKDLFTDAYRPDALLCFAMVVGSSPSFGPAIGEALMEKYGSYRCLVLFTLGFGFIAATAGLLLCPETYVFKIEDDFARQMRRDTGNHAIRGRREAKADIEKRKRGALLLRPYFILTRAYVFFVGMYASYVFGSMYFHIHWVWRYCSQQLPPGSTVNHKFINAGFLVGMFIAAWFIAYTSHLYRRRLHSGCGKVYPELRLLPMLAGSVFLPTSGLILGFVEKTTPILGFFVLVLHGISFFSTFQSALNIIVDLYPDVSASAVSSLTFFRSLFAAVLPLLAAITVQHVPFHMMFRGLGWFNVALAFVPWFLFFFGYRLRGESQRWMWSQRFPAQNVAQTGESAERKA